MARFELSDREGDVPFEVPSQKEEDIVAAMGGSPEEIASMPVEVGENKENSVGLARGIVNLFKEAILKNDTIRGTVTSPYFAPAVSIASLIAAGLLHQGSEHLQQHGEALFTSMDDGHFHDLGDLEHLGYYLNSPEGTYAYEGAMDYIKSQVLEGGAAVAAGTSLLSIAKWGKDKLIGRGQEKETGQGVVKEENK
jgi:hypothetical protein